MEITSTEAQNNFGRYLKLAQFEDVVVTKNGKSIAVIKAVICNESDNFKVAEKADKYYTHNSKLSYEEFLKLSEASQHHYEYIDGEVYLLASPSFMHQSIVMEISNTMYLYFKDRKCIPLTAPFDVNLLKDENKNVVQPDILVICDTERINDNGKYTGIPSLVVEILSESTRNKDMLKKLDLYLSGGVSEYWIVNPFSKEIYVYYAEDREIKDYKVYKGNEIVNSIMFDTLKLQLDQVFQT